MQMTAGMRCAALAAAALFVATHAEAQSVRLTFDADDPIGGLVAGSTLQSQYAAYGISFAANAYAGPSPSLYGAATWASNTDMTIAASPGPNVGSLGAPELVSGNVLHGFAGWLGENGDPSWRASFSRAITRFSADFVGVGSYQDVHLDAYAGTTLVGSATGATTGQFTLSVSGSGITSVVVTPGDFNDWVGVDNISYTLGPTVAAIPEPDIAALLALGLGGVALWRRRPRGR